MTVAVRHVLPDEEPHFVAVVVETARLDFHVFAQHVEAHLLRHDQVVFERFVCRGGVKTVRPPSLIERTVLEDEFAVDHHAGDSVRGLAERRGTHTEVAFHGVDRALIDGEAVFHRVEERGFGRPVFDVLHFARHAEFAVFDHRAAGVERDAGFRIDDVGFHENGRFRIGDLRGTLNDHVSVIARNEFAVDDFRGVTCAVQKLTLFRDWFHPDGGPHTGDRRVPDAVGVGDLLAAGLPVIAGRVENDDFDLLLAFGFQGAGDVEAERSITADVRSDMLAVDVNVGFPVARFKVEDDVLVFPVGRNGDGTAVDEQIVFSDFTLDAGERRFDRVRHKDLSVPFLNVFASLDDGVVPQTVEVHPVFTDELGTGILGVCVFGRDLFSPGGKDRIFLDLPLGGAAQDGRNAQKREKRREQGEFFCHVDSFFFKKTNFCILSQKRFIYTIA